MAVTARIFGPTVAALLAGEFGDVRAAGALKAALFTVAPPADARFLSDLTGEVADASYTAGGVALTTVVVTYDAVTNTSTLDCDDVTFANLTASGIIAVVFYRATGVATTSPLLVAWDISPAEASAAAPYVLTIAVEGLLRQVVA